MLKCKFEKKMQWFSSSIFLANFAKLGESYVAKFTKYDFANLAKSTKGTYFFSVSWISVISLIGIDGDFAK